MVTRIKLIENYRVVCTRVSVQLQSWIKVQSFYKGHFSCQKTLKLTAIHLITLQNLELIQMATTRTRAANFEEKKIVPFLKLLATTVVNHL